AAPMAMISCRRAMTTPVPRCAGASPRLRPRHSVGAANARPMAAPIGSCRPSISRDASTARGRRPARARRIGPSRERGIPGRTSPLAGWSRLRIVCHGAGACPRISNEGMTVKQVRWANARPRGVFRLCTLAICILVLVCTFLTPGSRAQDGGDPVTVSERIKVRNAELYVEIRGPARSAPLLLWLHGGPGGPERPLFRYFNSDLERHSLVAYLDQRGTGRSFDRTADPARLTVAQHLEDLETVISYLRRAYVKEKIYLVGHSWGTVLGLLHAKAHPETVAALICVAPVVSFSEQQRRAYAFDLAEAERRGETDTLEELRK